MPTKSIPTFTSVRAILEEETMPNYPSLEEGFDRDDFKTPDSRRRCPITFERPTCGRTMKFIGCFYLICALIIGSAVLYEELFKFHHKVPVIQKPAIETVDSSLLTGNSLVKESSHQECPTIHLATVCGRYRATRNFYVLFKSILFHRSDFRIHYHLFVDNVSSKILKKLFETWRVPDVEISYYNTTDYERDISWISNSHYSNRYGLLKLVVPRVLAEKKIDKFILLDTDMVVNGDIRVLWDKFSELNGKSFLGLVENQSDWYFKDTTTVTSLYRSVYWPAKGRGYNTGVMLVDAKKAMGANWATMWRDIANKELVVVFMTSLADQDVINAAIHEHSHIATTLPCYFNIQLNNHTDLDKSCGNRDNHGIKIAHWNTPQKLKTDSVKDQYFKNLYISYQDWHGKLLEQSVCHRAKSGQPFDEISKQHDPCASFNPTPEDSMRTYLYYTDFEVEDIEFEKRNGITAVVQLSMDRFQALEDFATHWPGPISAAIYLKDNEASLLETLIEMSSTLSGRKNIGYHLAFKEPGWHYPINRMRNIALENVITPYVFLSDVDFLPSRDLYWYLKHFIPKTDGQDPLGRTALIVAAFENSQYKSDFPTNKAELIRQLEAGNITSFRQHIWPQGQAPTDYSNWKKATLPYRVRWKEDYEPFIVTSSQVARFDERFIGFGWNKVAHDMTLAAMGYDFIVLPGVFMIHQEHMPSHDIRMFRKDKQFHDCSAKLKEKLKSELFDTNPSFRSRFE